MSGISKIFVVSVALIALAGCGGVSGRAILLIPLVHEETLTFSPEEVAELTAIKLEHPALFDKLQKHNNANAARIHEQNKLALKQREEAWRMAGESDETIKVLRASLEKQFNIRPEKEPDKP